MSNTSTPEPAVTPQEAPPPENYPPGEKIANLLIGSGHLTEKQFRYAKRVRSKLPTPKRLLEVIEDLGFITHSQLQEALQAEPAHLQVGSLLIELGYVRGTTDPVVTILPLGTVQVRPPPLRYPHSFSYFQEYG